MTTGLDFMLLPFIGCLLLIFIMVYFGIHVIEREIIFVDIALAQIAALGSAVSLVLDTLNIGHQHHVQEHDSRTFMAYLFCLIAAGIFTLLKNKQIKIPLEAIIGIAYAVATTSAVIILDKGAGSDVHIHDMLAGSILWVSRHQVFRLFIIVLIIGGFHYFFREKFKGVTQFYKTGETNITNPGLWDFLFYFSFGIVIVEAVAIGGIITIFAFLIIPSSISTLFATRWTSRVLIGLLVGGIATILGLYLSWVMDVPCSPTIILFLAAILLLSVLFKGILKYSNLLRTKTNN
ncbi:MAG: metal ABC transporter permease [Bacteroidales bacterium]|jgi:zinc/manganese transport system permease protein|nr:metal ABC transporter permease [Bacteroidales bacterium]